MVGRRHGTSGRGHHRGWQWTAGVALLVLAVPGLANAERRREKRQVPSDARLTAPAQLREGRVADPVVESAIDALRSGFPTAQGPTLARRGESREVYISRSRGGYVQALVAPPGTAYQVARAGEAAPDQVAAAFLREHAVAFGISRMGTTLHARVVRTSRGRTFVRLEQRFGGLPVFGAGAVVQVEEAGGISYALVDLARDDARLFAPDFPTQPTVDPEDALDLARQVLPFEKQVPDLVAGTPELMVFEPSVIGSAGPSRLVWHVRVQSPTAAVNEVVLVDAEKPEVAFHYSEIMDAKLREVYDSNNTSTLPGTLELSDVPEDLTTSVADAQQAFDYFGDTYDYYFNNFGRDSYDDAGATLVARVRYCEPGYPCPFANAYWNGSEMRFGDGYASADDVVAHELTHAVTTNESNLIYWGESGAINEALSDIFGELVDLSNGAGDDTPGVKWLLGEDLPIGYIRSMSDPTVLGDPDRRFSPNWYVEDEDNRGVHINSGVANKLAYLLAEGGTFNGETVAPLGVDAVGDVFYEVQGLLGTGSDYFDLYAALRQAASNLAWAPEAREALERACRAVEIDLPGNLETVFQDDFEGSFPGSWSISDPGGTGTQWGRSSWRQSGGTYSLYSAGGGASPSLPSPPNNPEYPPNMDTWIIYGPFPLSATHEAWAEFDLYLDVEADYDDVFWGVSVDGSIFDGYAVTPWDTGGCTISCSPSTWVHELFNFKEISTPAIVGASQVWLAFNFTSDVEVQYEGAYVDNVVIKKAPSGGPFGSFDTPVDAATGVTGNIAVTGWVLDDVEVDKVEIYRDPIGGEPTAPNGKVYIGDGTFVPGARADVEAAYPGYPFAYRAGWGYMLLTNMLPGGGNGTFTLYAYATDNEAQTTLLGSKTITCDNANATKPFGTIDTPGQGQTISGVIQQWGWALTPQTATIPIDGSTIWVYVDGTPLGHPVYNLYRADIAGLFPGYNNTDGAVGYFVLDTTTLTNGMHSIAWSVTDDQGRTDGIGSRFFWVDN